MATAKIAIRTDTAANWTSANPVLETGEQGHETDTGRRKIGDGTTTWTSLAYIPVVPSTTTVTGNYTVVSGVDTVNVNVASATITLPAATIIGRRVTVRKISASAGTVTVSRAGTDDITRAPLTSVTLTSNGDFWTLECVASGRWELVDGFETISGTNDGIKRHDGTMEQYGVDVATAASASAVSGSTISFVAEFTDVPQYFVSVEAFGQDHFFVGGHRTLTAAAHRWQIRDTDATSYTGSWDVNWTATGRWYA